MTASQATSADQILAQLDAHNLLAELHDASAWDNPVPVGATGRTPAFPVDVFPSWISDMVLGLARDTQTDPAMAGSVAMSVLSACVGGRLEVEPKPGWNEPVNLFLAVVAAPGERKSPVHRALTKPLYDAEEHLIAKVEPYRSQQEALLAIAIRRADKAKHTAANADAENRDTQTADALGAAAELESIVVPARPKLIVDDITPESLATLMADHQGRMALISDEGGVFDVLAGRFNPNPFLEPYLKGHDGGHLSVIRRERSEVIHRPALTMGVMIQPSVLSKFGTDDALKGRGVVARFLFVLPVSLAGWREVNTEPVPEHIAAVYTQRIRDLALTAAERPEASTVKLTAEAQQVREHQAAAIEEALRPQGRFADDKDWANKFGGATIRLAGLLHMAHNPDSGWDQPIDGHRMADAVRLAEFFAAHHKAAGEAISTTKEMNRAQYVLNFLVTKDLREFARRDLARTVHRSMRPAAILNPVLEELIQLGWIRQRPDNRYELHPEAPQHLDDAAALAASVKASFTAPAEPYLRP